jgi:hypothetical protein
MRIQYKANGMQRTVRDVVGKVLIARGIARAVVAPRADEPAPVEYLRTDMQPEQPGEDISPRTGKPKRRYKRRDMQAES